MSDHTVESVGSTNNSRLATQQGVARATASMHRVMEEKRFRKEMKRREKEIREQRARDRIEREAREMFEANKWPPQQGAIPGPVCTSLNEKVNGFNFEFLRVDSWAVCTFLFPPLILQTSWCQHPNSARFEV